MFGVTGLRINMLSPDSAGTLREGASRLRYALWSLCFVAGHIVGGALSGAALGWLGGALPGWRETGLWVTAVVCVAYGLAHLGLLRLPLPHWPRQVPRGWMLRHPWNLVAFGYGLQLGCAFATRITVATVYPVLALAMLSGSPAQGALLMGVFGFIRSLPPVLAGPWVDSPARSLRVAHAFDTRQPLVWKLNGVALLTASLLFLAAAWGGLRA